MLHSLHITPLYSVRQSKDKQMNYDWAADGEERSELSDSELQEDSGRSYHTILEFSLESWRQENVTANYTDWFTEKMWICCLTWSGIYFVLCPNAYILLSSKIYISASVFPQVIDGIYVSLFQTVLKMYFYSLCYLFIWAQNILSGSGLSDNSRVIFPPLHVPNPLR